MFSAKIVRIRIKGQSKVLPVTGFANVDRSYLAVEKTVNGKLDFIAVMPYRDNDKIYKRATEIGRQDGMTKYRVQTVTARRDGESVIMALTAFCDVDKEYLLVAGEEFEFTITEFEPEKYRNLIEWNEIDEIIGACNIQK